MKKIFFVLTAVAMVCFMATSAMAFKVDNRSAEMTEESLCDQAGTIKMTFDQTDWDDIDAYLMDGNDYAEIRITITGTDLELDQDQPKLCKDIQASATADGVPHTGELVELDQIGVEISDPLGNGYPDFQAYVWGEDGGQIIHVYITELDASPVWTDENLRPWFRIGLYNELVDIPDATTEICCDVHDFQGFNKLTISNETTPQGLVFTGDNEIGHFGPQEIDQRECNKTLKEGCYNETEEIQLCDPETDASSQQEICATYYECFVLEGDFPTGGEFEMQLSTDTPGVYLYDIDVTSISGGVSWDYFESDCETAADSGACDWEAKCATTDGYYDLSDIADDKLVFCVSYNVNVDEAIAGDVVEFKVSGNTIPCGALFSETIIAADLVKCQGVEDSMYFPYVLSDTAPWNTGIVVTNLASDSIPAEEMVVTFNLTDKNGDTYTETVNNLTEIIWASNLDAAIASWGWNPAAGSCWLQVVTNFPVDGWCYHSNGVFGAGTLPRLTGDDDSCSSN